LEDSVKKRTHELEQANKDLAQANRLVHKTNQMQLQHFASMSHEIRTPLNCVIGISSVLRESKLTLFQQESVDMIARSGDLLMAIINDVLDYSKLETDNVIVDIRKNNLQELLDFVLQSMASKAQGTQSIASCFDVTLPEQVHMDNRRVQQILFNLLGNAFKFSPIDGTIEFSVRLIDHPDDDHCPWKKSNESVGAKSAACPMKASIPAGSSISEENANAPAISRCPFHRNTPKVETVPEIPSIPRRVLRFVVKDNGKGIDQKDLKRIFQPFQQSSSATESVYGGTGLGLAITQKIVNALGGTISVESEKGSWSQFTVDLPCVDKPVNVHDISSQVKSWAVYLVGFTESERYKAMQIMAPFAMNLSILSSMSEIPTAKAATTMVLLVHEDCFESSCMAGLTSAQSTLFTFGRKFSVDESFTAHHFQSLDHMIPSFFVHILVQHVTKQKFNQSMNSMMDLGEPSVEIGKEEKGKDGFSYLRVLVVEDNIVNQKVLSRMLQRLKVQHVDIVSNGLEACEKEASTHYDLILMDQQMPVMNGVEACRRILASNRLAASRSARRPPQIVFVTAHVMASGQVECSEAGGSGFVPKPFKLEDIERCLRNVCHQ
jgi:signal transduction histidine kinase/CheY-like chemotaxis protein